MIILLVQTMIVRIITLVFSYEKNTNNHEALKESIRYMVHIRILDATIEEHTNWFEISSQTYRTWKQTADRREIRQHAKQKLASPWYLLLLRSRVRHPKFQNEAWRFRSIKSTLSLLAQASTSGMREIEVFQQKTKVVPLLLHLIRDDISLTADEYVK